MKKYYVITSDEKFVYDHLEGDLQFMSDPKNLEKIIEEVKEDTIAREQEMLKMEEGEDKEQERGICEELKELCSKLHIAEIEVEVTPRKEE